MSKSQEVRVIGVDLHPSCFAAAVYEKSASKTLASLKS